jgi:hypothetical protein
MTSITKSFIILIVSCLSLSNLFAQNLNSFAGIRLGYALPMGQFASHDFETGGYALLGKSISGEAAWFITPKVGFGIDISNSSFGFASGYYRDDYLENEPSYKSMQLLSGPYKVQTFMGGVYYKVNYGKKFFSTFKLMGGIYAARTPDQFYGVVDAFFLREHFFWKTGSLDRTFGFLTGASFEYHIFEHVSLLLQADFSYAEPAFIYDTGNDFYTVNIKMPILKLLPGINIHF